MSSSLFFDIMAWAEDHVRLFQTAAAIVGILIGAGGFLVGWGLRHLKAQRDRKRYLRLENDEQLVFEGHVLLDMPDGSIKLDVETWGPKHSLQYVFNDRMLESELRKVAKRKSGLVSLPPPGQFLMMTSLRDAVVGNDWTANPAALKGRPVQEDQIILAPVLWPGIREDCLFRIVVLDIDWMPRLCDEAVIKRIVAANPYYQHRAQWLHDIAVAWVREKEKSRDEATIWQVVIRSAKWN